MWPGTTWSADPVAAKRRMAYVPDDPKLFESLTVWEHLEFVAAAYRLGDFAAKAEDLLRQFELVEKRNAPAQELSRGMRQKVAIACAYLHDPAAILFDEPLTGLDPAGIRTAKESIVRRAERRRRGGNQFPSAFPGRRRLHAPVDPAPGQAVVFRAGGRSPHGFCGPWCPGLAGRGVFPGDRAFDRTAGHMIDERGIDQTAETPGAGRCGGRSGA